jgi:hypothetical protein
MTTKEALTQVKALIPTKEHWFGGDQVAKPGSMCLVWAVDRAARNKPRVFLDALAALSAALPRSARISPSHSENVIFYNDDHTYKACMRVLDRAIEAAS